MDHESVTSPVAAAPTAATTTTTTTAGRPRSRSLVVGSANDPAERQADAVAATVVSQLRRSFDDDRIRVPSDGAPSKIAPISRGRSDVVPPSDPSRPRIARSTTPSLPPLAGIGVLRRSPEPRVIRRYGGDEYAAKEYEAEEGDAYGVYGAESDDDVEEMEDLEAVGVEADVEEAGPPGTVYDVVPELPSPEGEPHVYDEIPDLEGDERGYSVPDLHDDPSQQTHEGHAMAHAVHAGAEPKPRRRKNKAPKKYRGTHDLNAGYLGEDQDPEANDNFKMALEDIKRHQVPGATAEQLYKRARMWGWDPSDVDKYLDAKDGLVKYLDEVERTRYELNVGSAITQGPDERPFDTSGMRSYKSGPGFAAFVMSQKGELYADQHKVGLFHHSSFLGGGSVACAGEIMVVGGTVKAITNKSGHYTPTDAMLVEVLEVLAAGGVALSGLMVYHRNDGKQKRFGIPGDQFTSQSFTVPPYTTDPILTKP